MSELTFPKPVSLSKADFFSGGNIPPAPIPEALDVLAKYKGDDDLGDTSSGTDPKGSDEPAYLKGDVNITKGVEDLLGKYSADDDGPAEASEATPKPTAKATDKPEVKAVEPNEEAGTAETTETVESIEPNSGDFASVANLLQEKGLIVEIPEGFPIEDVNSSNFWELIDHNFNKRAEETFSTGYDQARNDIASGLLPEVLEMVNFQLENPNITPEEVKLHIEHIFYQKDIANLDPTDPIEAETIIRQYLSGSKDYTVQEIDELVKEAKDLNRLEHRANQFKPKLEARLRQDVQRKQQERQELLDIEAANHEAFLTRVRGILDKGDINGVPLGSEEKSKLWGIFSNNRIPVPVPGGKTVEMGYMNFLVAKNMYSKEANHDNLLLAALILEGGPKAMEKYISAPAIKKEVAAFKSQAATGVFRSAPATQQPGTKASAKTDSKTFFSRQLR